MTENESPIALMIHFYLVALIRQVRREHQRERRR